MTETNTKSYNQSGVFLQAYVLNELVKRKWVAKTEHPVVVAPFRKDPNSFSSTWGAQVTPSPETFVSAIRDSQNNFELSERSIDIISGRFLDDNRRIHLCIECKKLNPKYTEWCFFLQYPHYIKPHLISKSSQDKGRGILFQIPKTTGYGNEIYLSINYSLNDAKLFSEKIADFGIALTNEKLSGEYYKTEKTVVDIAARQIIEGTYGVTIDTPIHQLLNHNAKLFGTTDFFIPIIVTNTKLKFCIIQPDKIDPTTGQFIGEPEYEDVNSLVYQCNPPKTVQYPEPLVAPLDGKTRNEVSRWYVLVMNPIGFQEFLDRITALWGPADLAE